MTEEEKAEHKRTVDRMYSTWQDSEAAYVVEDIVQLLMR